MATKPNIFAAPIWFAFSLGFGCHASGALPPHIEERGYPLAQAPPVNLVSEAVEHLYVAPGPAFGIGVHATRAGMRVWGQGECIRVRHSLSSGKQPNATKHQQYRTSKEY